MRTFRCVRYILATPKVYPAIYDIYLYIPCSARRVCPSAVVGKLHTMDSSIHHDIAKLESQLTANPLRGQFYWLRQFKRHPTMLINTQQKVPDDLDGVPERVRLYNHKTVIGKQNANSEIRLLQEIHKAQTATTNDLQAEFRRSLHEQLRLVMNGQDTFQTARTEFPREWTNSPALSTQPATKTIASLSTICSEHSIVSRYCQPANIWRVTP
jgi:hypothetical protein